MVSTYDEYQRKALRTLNVKDKEENILHCVMGMSGEIAEYIDCADERDKAIAELGDCLWYLAVLCDQLGMPMSALHGKNHDLFKPALSSAVISSGRMTDMVKKMWFYGKDLDEDKVIDECEIFLTAVDRLCRFHGETLLSVMMLNIAKLQRRYPDKFDAELAKNHNGQ